MQGVNRCEMFILTNFSDLKKMHFFWMLVIIACLIKNTHLGKKYYIIWYLVLLIEVKN